MRLKTIAMMLTLGIAAGGEAPAQQAAPLNPTNFGLVSPQPQSELPHSATPPQQAVRKPKRPAQARLVPSGADSWVLSDGWELPKRIGWSEATVRFSIPPTILRPGTIPSFPERC